MFFTTKRGFGKVSDKIIKVLKIIYILSPLVFITKYQESAIISFLLLLFINFEWVNKILNRLNKHEFVNVIQILFIGIIVVYFKIAEYKIITIIFGLVMYSITEIRIDSKHLKNRKRLGRK